MVELKSEEKTENEEIVVFKAYSRVCLIAFAGTILSLVLFLLVLNQNMRALEQDFRHDITVKVLSLRHKTEVLEQFWEDIQSFYTSSLKVEDDEFRSFAESALKYNDLLFISWLPLDTEIFAENDIHIISRNPDEEEHFKSFIIQNENIHELIEQVQATSEIAIELITIPTIPDHIVSEHNKIAIAVPTFKKQLHQPKKRRITGVMISLIDTGSFFSSIFKNEEKNNISVYLIDTQQETEQLIFEHAADQKILPETPEEFKEMRSDLSVTRTILFASQALKITATPTFIYMGKSAGWDPWIALLMGIVLTAFTAFWFYQQISRNIAIQKIVHEKTRALASSEKHMRAILDNTVDGIITINDDGIIQTYNPACEEIFGYRAEEAVGKNVKLLMPDPYHSEHDSYIGNYLKTGEAKIIGIGREVTGKRKDGSTFPMELSIGEVKNKTHSFVGIIRDITERKEAEQTRERLAAIVESSDDAIISMRLDGTITSWNKGAESLYGYRADEAVGQNIRIIIPPERLNEEDKIIAALKEDKTIDHFETVRVNKNGDLLNISATISPLKDSHGNIIGASKVARDITERKKAEKRLKEYTKNLKRSNQELDDFVYIVSHDLKEPLRGLYSYAQFLQEDYEDKLDQEGKDKLNTLKKLASRMEELIDTLLYYSRLGRSELAFRNTDLNKVLEKTLDLIEPVAKENNATIDIHDKLPIIRCDRARVGEIFRNLIINAIKYNDHEDKHVEIGCTTDHKDYPARNVFYVADNGIGIDEKHREIVFKMFKRLHGRDDYGGGTGSGLAFVKKIIDRHGGKIWIESNKDKGSTFYFTLEG